MKTLFLKFKIYFIIAAFLSVAIGSWSVRGWYEDGKVVTALKKQKKEYENQAAIDAELLTNALNKEQALRITFRSLKNESNKTKLCSNGGRDFLRLFNRSAVAANTKK